jgi:Na+/melibiose symporter-like transporter
MKSLFKRKKGSGYVWLYGLIMLFSLGLVWILTATPVEKVYDALENTTGDPQAENTKLKMKNNYMIAPLILMFAIFIFMLIGSQRREYYYPGR